MTSSELQDEVVSTLAREPGGSRRGWRLVIGPLRIYDQATHPLCNWSVSPSGDTWEVEVVERLLDTFRLAHPLVTRD